MKLVKASIDTGSSYTSNMSSIHNRNEKRRSINPWKMTHNPFNAGMNSLYNSLHRYCSHECSDSYPSNSSNMTRIQLQSFATYFSLSLQSFLSQTENWICCFPMIHSPWYIYTMIMDSSTILCPYHWDNHQTTQILPWFSKEISSLKQIWFERVSDDRSLFIHEK